ncbi:MAG: hypothetical protein M1839_002223 [Geoglossum umbratile]|nr:MAG: hypothetical protein M1839_002223 [Geoglossum umbratile]
MKIGIQIHTIPLINSLWRLDYLSIHGKMDQAQVEIIERRIAEDRGKYYRGTAVVRFEYLHFGSQCPRQLNRENVESLKDTFRREGCLRLEPKHHIPALIDQQVLDLAIESSRPVSLDTLLKNPEATPPELKMP